MVNFVLAPEKFYSVTDRAIRIGNLERVGILWVFFSTKNAALTSLQLKDIAKKLDELNGASATMLGFQK